MNYRAPAYLGYAQSDRTMFPVSHRNKRYHAKEWVLGVELGPVAKAYPFQELAKTEGRVVDRVGSREVVVTFDAESATAWVATPSGEILNSVRAYWFAWFTFHPDTEIFVAED